MAALAAPAGPCRRRAACSGGQLHSHPGQPPQQQAQDREEWRGESLGTLMPQTLGMHRRGAVLMILLRLAAVPPCIHWDHIAAHDARGSPACAGTASCPPLTAACLHVLC